MTATYNGPESEAAGGPTFRAAWTSASTCGACGLFSKYCSTRWFCRALLMICKERGLRGGKAREKLRVHAADRAHGLQLNRVWKTKQGSGVQGQAALSFMPFNPGGHQHKESSQQTHALPNARHSGQGCRGLPEA